MTMQSAMKMPMPMPTSMAGMPLQSMMPLMMATMTMKMDGNTAVCQMSSAQGIDKKAFQNSCEMMQMMIDSGMPMIMQCGNLCLMGVSDGPAKTMPMMMPMMSVMPTMMCTMHFEIKDGSMACHLVPSQGMDMTVFKASCKLMEKMMHLGMPMMFSCNGAPVMCCTI